MAINPQEAELRRLTNIKALVRKEIDTTNDIRKKEVLRNINNIQYLRKSTQMLRITLKNYVI